MKETEEKILKAATKLFSEYGFNGVSTKKIAEVAGVNEVTIFRHFTNKSNLLQAVIKHFAFEGNIIEKVKRDITGDVEKDLRIFAEDYYMFLKNNIKMYKIITFTIVFITTVFLLGSPFHQPPVICLLNDGSNESFRIEQAFHGRDLLL